MKRVTLLLVSPPVLYDPRLWAATLPCKPHLLSLAGFVRDVADTRLIDLAVTMGAPRTLGGVDAFLEGLDEHLPLAGVDLVGISCWTSFHYQGALAVARSVRARAPNLPIVVGGHHATAAPEDFAEGGDLFDFVVRGDGEHALRSLCREQPRRPASPRVVEGTPFQLTDPDHIEWAEYPWHDERHKILALNLSRGCPFDCDFCVGRAPTTSAYAVEDALDLLERLAARRAPNRILLLDPLFGASRRWLTSFLDGLEERQLGLKLWAETRADLLSVDLLDRLHANDFWVDFGLDSGSAEMVRRQRKSRSPERYLGKAREILRHADAIGMPHLIYLLFNFPGETPGTTRETMEFVEALVDEGGPVSGLACAQSFFILPGTGAYRHLDAYETELGTEVRHPTWWRERGNQHALATDILPSAAFAGHEEALDQWKTWQIGVSKRWTPRRPRAVNATYMQVFGGR